MQVLTLLILSLAQAHKILILSDIHLSNKTEPSHFMYNQDTQYDGLKEFIYELKKREQQFDTILITGDFCGHNIVQQDPNLPSYFEIQIKVMEQIYDLIQNTYPQSKILTTLGNNDLMHHDQVPNISDYDYYYGKLAKVFFKNLELDNNQMLNYMNGGYYTKKTNGQCYMSLNSNYFRNINNSTEKQLQKQLEFIQNEFQQNNCKFVIFFHIPFGLSYFKEIQYYWNLDVQNKMMEIFKKFEDKIEIIIAAHEHSAQIKNINEKNYNFKFPYILVPSVSPVYNNNPSYSVLNINQDSFNLQTNVLQIQNLIENSFLNQFQFKNWWQYDTNQLGIQLKNYQTIQDFFDKMNSTDIDNQLLRMRGFNVDIETFKKLTQKFNLGEYFYQKQYYCQNRNIFDIQLWNQCVNSII